MAEHVVIAAGLSEYGTWQITVRRQADGDYAHAVRLIDHDGHIQWLGGSGGPPVSPDCVLNVASAGQGAGPYEVDVLVPPEVRAVAVTTAGGEAITMPLHDSAAFSEVRFGLLLLDRTMRLTHVTAYDEDCCEMDRFDMGFHQHFWHGR